MDGFITDGLSSDVSVFLATILGTALEGELRIGDVSTINRVLGCLSPQLGKAHRSTEVLATKDALRLDTGLRDACRPWQLGAKIRDIWANLVTEHCRCN